MIHESVDSVEDAERKCSEAFEKSKTATGLDKMRLLYEAFPFKEPSFHTTSDLIFKFEHEGERLVIYDSIGYITMVPISHPDEIISILQCEAQYAGAFRRLITGRDIPIQPPPPREHIGLRMIKKGRVLTKPAPKKGSISLDDLGL